MREIRSLTDGIKHQCEKCNTIFRGKSCPQCEMNEKKPTCFTEVPNEYAEWQKQDTLNMEEWNYE